MIRILNMPDTLMAMDMTPGDGQLSYDLPRRESRAEAAAQAVEQRIADAGLQPGPRLRTRGELPEALARGPRTGDAGLQPGHRLGTRSELRELLAVAPSTVSETIKLLEARGRVVTRTG